MWRRVTTLSVFSSDDMRRVCTRISHEIIERNNGAENLVFLGLLKRGALIASRLSTIISDIEETTVPVYSLDITSARDDRAHKESASPALPADIVDLFPPFFPSEPSPNTDLSKSHVVLVDDVLFTGRSVRAAMDTVSRVSRPLQMQLAVLIDRGHRELPIRADFIGKNLPTKRSEQVHVLMNEIDGVDRIDVDRGDLT